jgi:hypothetical protein
MGQHTRTFSITWSNIWLIFNTVFKIQSTIIMTGKYTCFTVQLLVSSVNTDYCGIEYNNYTTPEIKLG